MQRYYKRNKPTPERDQLDRWIDDVFGRVRESESESEMDR